MKYRRSYFFAAVMCCLIITSLLEGCGRRKASEKVVATINNYKMTVEDFNYESKEIFHMGRLVGHMPDTKEEILDALIVKEVLLQEAEKKDLDKDKEFLRSIEMYWEQTLIKNLMKKKFVDIQNKVTVYEEEVIDYYHNMMKDEQRPLEGVRRNIKREIKSKKERDLLDEWIEDLRSKSRIRVDKKVLNEL